MQTDNCMRPLCEEINKKDGADRIGTINGVKAFEKDAACNGAVSLDSATPSVSL